MGRHFRQPDPATISQMFSLLFNRRFTANASIKMKLGSRDEFTAATFRNEHGTLIGMVAMDMNMSAAMGCALSLMPRHVYKSILQSSEFDDMSWENLEEVYNVATRFFHNAFSGTHIQIDEVFFNPTTMPREYVRMLRREGRRYDFDCQLHGYEKGKMVFVGMND